MCPFWRVAPSHVFGNVSLKGQELNAFLFNLHQAAPGLWGHVGKLYSKNTLKVSGSLLCGKAEKNHSFQHIPVISASVDINFKPWPPASAPKHHTASKPAQYMWQSKPKLQWQVSS